jgi:hypothetical protein
MPVARPLAAVFAHRDVLAEVERDRTRFVGAQATDAELAVALVDLAFRVPVAVSLEMT